MAMPNAAPMNVTSECVKCKRGHHTRIFVISGSRDKHLNVYSAGRLPNTLFLNFKFHFDSQS